MDGLQKFIVIVVIGIFLFFGIRSCSPQAMTRSWGGTMDITLEPNEKLIEVTWKDNSLWFLTKKMTDNDIAESYAFYEKDTIGMLEGCVNIDEVKMTQEELEEYQKQQQYAYDYYLNGNYDEYNHPVFIQYNAETDTYTLLKPYSYGEDGGLVPAN